MFGWVATRNRYQLIFVLCHFYLNSLPLFLAMIKNDDPSQQFRYFTKKEVAAHNTEDDLWVTALGNVYDLTELCRRHKTDWGHLVDPIVQAAGLDISHWFDVTTKDVRTHVHIDSGLTVYFTPMGRFLHVPPPDPSPIGPIDTVSGIPWWQNEAYRIGKLTERPRLVRIINTLNHHSVTVEVSTEETVAQIRERYLLVNAHALSYRWTRLGKDLDMSKTLVENGIEDDSAELEELRIPDDAYVAAIHLTFDDDLTVA